MNRTASAAWPFLWTATTIAVAIVAVTAFLRDVVFHDWRSWAIAASLVFSVAGALFALKRGQLARAIVWAASLAIVTLLVVYDLLDAMIDPFMDADWPIVIVAVLLVLALERILWTLISDED